MGRKPLGDRALSPAGGLAAGWFSLYRIQRPIHRLGGKQVLVGDMDDPLR